MGFGDFLKKGARIATLGASDILTASDPKAYDPEKGNFGVPSYSRQYDNYGQQATGFAHRGGPQMAGAQMGDSAFRGDQSALVRMLQQQAAGRGPGQQLVRMQAQGAADRGLQQQMAMQAGAAPGGGAMAARSAALGAGQMQSAVGGQAAMAGLQAQMGATDQLGGVLSGARGQDLARGQANMQSQLATQQGNMQGRLQQTAMNDQAQLEALRQRLALAGMQQQGGQAYEQMRYGGHNAIMGMPTQGEKLFGMASGIGKMAMSGGAGGAAGAPTAAGPAMGGNGSAYTPWGSPR